MKNELVILLFLGFLVSCSEPSNSESKQYQILRELDLKAIELGHTNKKLAQLITSDSVTVASLRVKTDSIVNRLIDIKYELIDATGGIREFGTFYEFFNPENTSITQAFLFDSEQRSIPAATEIIGLINAFDEHPLTTKPLYEFLLGVIDDDEQFLNKELFKNCNLNDAVEMIEIIEKRILYAEQKTLIGLLEQSGNRR